MQGILDDVLRALGPDTIGQMAGRIGASPQQTQSAIQAALPLLMGAMARNAATPSGAEALHRAAVRDHAANDPMALVGALLGGMAGAAAPQAAARPASCSARSAGCSAGVPLAPARPAIRSRTGSGSSATCSAARSSGRPAESRRPAASTPGRRCS